MEKYTIIFFIVSHIIIYKFIKLGMSFMEYNNFRDNIKPTVFDFMSMNILNWIKENRTEEEFAKDPNAYEMTNLFLFGAKVARIIELTKENADFWAKSLIFHLIWPKSLHEIYHSPIIMRYLSRIFMSYQ